MSHITFSTEIQTDRFLFQFKVLESPIVDTTVMKIITPSCLNVDDRMDFKTRKLIPGGVVEPGKDILVSPLLPKLQSLRYGFGHTNTKYWKDTESYKLESVMKTSLVNIPFYIIFDDFRIEMAPEKSKFLQTLEMVCDLVDRSI